MVVLALVFLIVLILPLAEPITKTEDTFLRTLDITVWAIFVLEYLARVYLSLHRGRYIRKHWLDLIVIGVPFLRPFRLIRVLAIMITTARRAGGVVVERITIYVVAMTAIILSVSAVLVYHFEHNAPGANIHTLGQAFWWGIVTVTTVGYGDKFPVTVWGQVTASVLMLTAIALMGTITAAVASAFVSITRRTSREQLEEELEQDVQERIDVGVAEVEAEVSATMAADQVEADRRIAALQDAVAALHDELRSLRADLAERG